MRHVLVKLEEVMHICSENEYKTASLNDMVRVNTLLSLRAYRKVSAPVCAKVCACVKCGMTGHPFV